MLLPSGDRSDSEEPSEPENKTSKNKKKSSSNLGSMFQAGGEKDKDKDKDKRSKKNKSEKLTPYQFTSWLSPSDLSCEAYY